ncbi:MAG: hypothetical protein JRJ46_10320 [Deltaproteobacteria bacterium]|jgi:hypothetical protein|nr:hypothetical protein [Deltaproteobacteria bacterium]
MVDDTVLSCSWDEFEEWIRQKINGDFSWKIRLLDSKNSRGAIIDSIETSIKNNNGTFPEKGEMFIEKLSPEK